MKVVLWAAGLALLAGPILAAGSQNRPVACALDQISPAERASAEKQYAAVVGPTSLGDPPTDVVNLIGRKVEHCPDFKTFSHDQAVLALNYANSSLLLDVLSARLIPTAGRATIDAFWNGAPDDLKLAVNAAASRQDGPPFRLAGLSASSQDYILDFLHAHALSSADLVALVAAGEIKAVMNDMETRWDK